MREIREVKWRLDEVLNILKNIHPPPVFISESDLLVLPDHLRKTFLVVAAKGECTGAEVSIQTGRSRGAESSYLNQLVRLGWLLKRRRGKNVVFSVKPRS